MEDIIVIGGPTGVGKTKLSVELAKKIDAEIINADSVAIYKELNIGSAKPTIEEREGIPHHLIDIRNVDEEYNVYEYQNDIRKLIKDITGRGKRIIIVGGTGLYIKAALFNYEFKKSEIPNNDFDELTNTEILEKIKEIDKACNIHVNNRQRLVRYLNKLLNKDEISNKKDELLYPCTIIGLTTDRNILYERINNRVDKMIDNGLINEIDTLKEHYKTSRILNSAIGYKEFKDYLFSSRPLDDVVVEIKKDSRHYAKRQYTFFNNQFNIKWFAVNFKDFNETINEVYNYIKKTS